MLKNLIRKFRLYIWTTRDDKNFYSFVNKVYPQSADTEEMVTLVDFTHLGFKRWNIQLLCTLLGISSVEKRKIIAFYPSYFFIWNTFQSKAIWILKKIFNKDKNIFKLMNVNDVITPSYFSFIRSKNKKYTFKTKEDVLSFEYSNIKIGDLVYDSYLKENRKATVDIHSKELELIINKACFLMDYYNKEFCKHDIKEVYLTHAVYLCYGIAARVALSHGAKVFVTQNTRGKELHRLSIEHPLQTPDFSSYPATFDELSSPSLCIEESRKELENRFEGVINSSISYMRQSAYSDISSTLTCFSEEYDNLLIMLHCFFDSPHIYKSMLYPDFYEWAEDTIDVALSSGKKVFIKEHPNGMPGNDRIIQELKNKYKDVTFLDKKTSNLSIMRCKIDCVASVYGTLGHEFPYKNIPVINAGENPHSAFDFCYNPVTIEEYRSLIRKVGKLDKPSLKDKEDILKFYYIHNIHNGQGVNQHINKSIIEKFQPKAEYNGMLTVLEELDLSSFIEASKTSYLSVR